MKRHLGSFLAIAAMSLVFAVQAAVDVACSARDAVIYAVQKVQEGLFNVFCHFAAALGRPELDRKPSTSYRYQHLVSRLFPREAQRLEVHPNWRMCPSI